jgi:hypothetical protein
VRIPRWPGLRGFPRPVVLGSRSSEAFTTMRRSQVVTAASPRKSAAPTMPRGSSESWIRCSTPGSRTAAGYPDIEHLRRPAQITSGSRGSAWR